MPIPVPVPMPMPRPAATASHATFGAHTQLGEPKSQKELKRERERAGAGREQAGSRQGADPAAGAGRKLLLESQFAFGFH